MAAVNLSCGYYEAHTSKEYVVLAEMKKAIAEAKKIIKKEVEKPFEYIEMLYGSKFDYDSYYGYYDGYDYYRYARKPKNIDEGDITQDEDDYGNLYMLQDRTCEVEYVFHIIFFDKETQTEKVAEVLAVTEYEAIGMFLDKFVEYTRQDIYEIKRFN